LLQNFSQDQLINLGQRLGFIQRKILVVILKETNACLMVLVENSIIFRSEIQPG